MIGGRYIRLCTEGPCFECLNWMAGTLRRRHGCLHGAEAADFAGDAQNWVRDGGSGWSARAVHDHRLNGAYKTRLSEGAYFGSFELLRRTSAGTCRERPQMKQVVSDDLTTLLALLGTVDTCRCRSPAIRLQTNRADPRTLDERFHFAHCLGDRPPTDYLLNLVC